MEKIKEEVLRISEKTGIPVELIERHIHMAKDDYFRSNVVLPHQTIPNNANYPERKTTSEYLSSEYPPLSFLLFGYNGII